MPDHAFHRTIGNLIKTLGYIPDKEIWLDPACGGHEVAPLSNGAGSEAVRFCQVDILIVAYDRLVIIEIEESDVKPLHILGKFYASAFSTHHDDQDISNLPLLFIQVLDTKKVNLEEGKKGEQLDQIEAILMEQAEKWPDRTVEYRLFKGQEANFKAEGTEGQELVQAIKDFLGDSAFTGSDPKAADGLTIKVRSAWGAEQLFQLTGNALRYRSEGPPHDTLRGQVLLSQPQVETIDGLLQKVRVGPVPMGWPGLDGETTTITIRQGQNSVELEYWEAPKPWKPLEKLVEMLRECVRDQVG